MKKLLITLIATPFIVLPVYADKHTDKKIKNGLKEIVKVAKTYDANGDNKITKVEYEKATGEMNFGDLDLNNDGRLTIGELAVNRNIEKRKAKDPTFEPDTDKVIKTSAKIDSKIAKRAKARDGGGKDGGNKGVGKGNRGGGNKGANRGGRGGDKGSRGGRSGGRGGKGKK